MKQTEVLKRILQKPATWHSRKQEVPAIILNAQARISRNLRSHRFPSTCSESELAEVREEIVRAGRMLPKFENGIEFQTADLSKADHRVLAERLFLPMQMNPSWQSLLLLSSSTSSMMRVNVEDHLHLIVSRPGLGLRSAWKEANRFDTLLGGELDFAYKQDIGFLTASPDNAGTGLRASIALHVPGLVLAGQLNGVLNSLRILRFRVTNFYDDRSEITGNIIRISNWSCFGLGEEEIIGRVEDQANEIRTLELQARQLLLETQPELLFDYVSRSYGTLRYAYSLSRHETAELLSALRLGIDCGMFANLPHSAVNSMELRILPGHMRMSLPLKATRYTESVERANFIRQRLDSLR